MGSSGLYIQINDTGKGVAFDAPLQNRPRPPQQADLSEILREALKRLATLQESVPTDCRQYCSDIRSILNVGLEHAEKLTHQVSNGEVPLYRDSIERAQAAEKAQQRLEVETDPPPLLPSLAEQLREPPVPTTEVACQTQPVELDERSRNREVLDVNVHRQERRAEQLAAMHLAATLQRRRR